MNKFLSLTIACGFAISAYAAGPDVLLNEDFNSAGVAHGQFADWSIDGWSQTCTQDNLTTPRMWCIYGSGTDANPNGVAYVECDSYSYSDPASTLPRTNVLYTPLLDLDGTYQLQFSWKSSGMALNANNPYDFRVKVVEEGADIATAPVIFDFLDPDLLLESGVQPTNGALWMGWAVNTSKLSLAAYNGKKVKLAFVYTLNSTNGNNVEIDDVSVKAFDAPASPIPTLSATEWRFGSVYVGSTVHSDVITLTNTGTAGLKITDVQAPAGFSVAFGTPVESIDLKTNETVQLQISYSATLTSPDQGEVVIKTNGTDAKIRVSADKRQVPSGGAFEGFEGAAFPPAGWESVKWKRTSAYIEGKYAAIPNAYYQEANYLRTPRVDASSTPATITFNYADFYYGEQADGADTEVKLQFSKDGGATWELVDTYDYNDEYNTIISKTYSREANSDNCYWRFVWDLTYYDSEYGAEASAFYLDAVVLSKLYGSNDLPAVSAAKSPADGATDVFNRDVVIEWEAVQFATGYKLYVGTDADATNIINGQVVDGLSYALGNLAYSTTYNWKVVPFNSKGDATGVQTWNFTTITDPTITTLPYTEGFDGQFPATGWYMTNDNGTHWDTNEVNPFDGKASAMANPRAANTSCSLETPDVKLPAEGDAFISFYWCDGVPVSMKKDDTGLVKNNTTVSDGISDISFEILVDGTWTRAALLSDKTNEYWIRERIDLSPYKGKTVAFRWVYTCYDYMKARGAAIDLVTIDASASEKLSFNVSNWDVDKVNYGKSATSPVFTLLNDGIQEVTIASVEFSAPNFTSTLNAGDKIAAISGTTFTVTFDAGETEAEVDATMTVTSSNGAKAVLPLHGIALPSTTLFFGFEQDENGSLQPEGLTMIDVDHAATIALSMVDYPHKGELMSFVVLNYKLNDWTISYPNTGDQCLVAFGNYNYGNTDDWAVSPRLTATSTSSFEFWGRNYEHADDSGYGTVWGAGEVYVMVSEDSDPTKTSAYTQVGKYTLNFPQDEEYTRYETNLSQFAGKQIYIALRNTSTEGLAYFFDDFQFNDFDNISGVERVAADGDVLGEVYATVDGGVLSVHGVDSADLVLVSMNGSIVAAANGVASIDVSGVASGVYLLSVNSGEGVRTLRVAIR